MPLFEVCIFHETIPATVNSPAVPGKILVSPTAVVASDAAGATLIATQGFKMPDNVDPSKIVTKVRSFT